MPLIRAHRGRYGRPLSSALFDRYVKYIVKNSQFLGWAMDPSALLKELRTTPGGVSVRRLMEGFYQHYANLNGKTIWGDKTPSFFRKIQELNELFPSARFIHIVRDGRDVYLSMKGRKTGRSNIAVAALEWSYKIKKAEAALAEIPPERSHSIHFEDLLANPRPVIQAACDFLGIPFEEGMLNFHKTSHKLIDKTHSGLISKPIDKKAVRKWKSCIKDEDNAVFERIAHRTLEEHGYEVVNQSGFGLIVRINARLKLGLGLPLRAVQVLWTALMLQASALLGRGTTLSGGKAYQEHKILIASPLGYTGLAYYDYSLAQALSEQKVKAALCTSDRWILGAYKNDFKLLPLYQHCSGEVNKVLKGINYMRSSSRILRTTFKAKAEIVHFQVIELPAVDLALMLMLKLMGKHMVYTPHDITHNKNYLLNKQIQIWIYKLVDRIVAHNEANAKRLEKDFAVDRSKVRLVPHGIYEYFMVPSVTQATARRDLGLKDKEKIILFLGNIKNGKGFEVLLAAMPLLKAAMPECTLLIAGRTCGGITDNWVTDTIRDLGIESNVIVRLGFIPDDQIIKYYMCSDLVVLPYTEISESAVLRFAQTCGKPVICSDIDVFADAIRHGQTGYLFRNLGHEDLARRIVEALKDPNLPEVGLRGRQALINQGYQWRQAAIKTKEMYEELLNK
jgi:glycosyltransferase involved in cell wall biosynthesis